MAREKVLQILAATYDGETTWDVVFPHIFERQFTFETVNPPEEQKRILRPEEVQDLEADVPIEWAHEDREYAIHVVRAARDQRDAATELINRHAKNWELERIAFMDRMLMHLAIAECMACQDIPVKVTINEVIELAKRYSTDKSGTFINGILDAIVKELKGAGKVVKTGRGLVE
jgi:N utilization substance protein B